MSAKSQNWSFLGSDILLQGEIYRNEPMKVFDWDKAATIIKERNAEFAEAGLATDWDNTGGVIYDVDEGGIVEDSYLYLGSTWAMPTLIVDGDEIACFMDDDGNREYKWTDSAKNIINDG